MASTLAVAGMNTGVTKEQMVAAFLASLPNLQVVPGSIHYSGDPRASGLYTGANGGTPINFDSPLPDGILLTTGFITTALGPNDSASAGHSYFADGLVYRSPELAVVAGVATTQTFDAATLTFQFIPSGTSIQFQYIFGSEEYNEFVGSPFDDVFAFFLQGINIALVPGTATPVSINTVNGDTNPDYFTDNNGGGLFLQYDGLVGDAIAIAPLLATAAVIPGQVYTIKIAICDVFDGFFDSAVFLTQFKSLGGNPGGLVVALKDGCVGTNGQGVNYECPDTSTGGSGCIAHDPTEASTGGSACRIGDPGGV